MADGGNQIEWRVTGMDCGACAGKVRGAVERLPGVSDVDVAPMTERLRLTLDEARSTPDQVEKAVRAIGYGISPRGSAPEKPKGGFVLPEGAFTGSDAATFGNDDEHKRPRLSEEAQPTWHATSKGWLVLSTGALLAAAWAVHLLTSEDVAKWAFVLATLIGLVPVARRAFAMARIGMPFTIEMLMTIAASGALVIGAAEEAALVVFLFAVGEMLEGVAASRARNGIRALAALVPKTALLETDGQTREVPAESLAIGQTVMVRPGDRIPADGEVIDGTSGVDESPVTGESVPDLKEPGSLVFAGSINTEAALRVRVEKTAEDNTIARIVRLVEEAESARAPTERFIDRFSRVYMPVIVGTAMLVATVPPLAFGLAWGEWIYRALALLLIGCPCALVISVPASIASALSAGARSGLLMKGGAVIEAVALVTHVAFDKTGTLTAGRPRVTDIVPIDGTPAEVLSLAAAVESGASHPLGLAILARAEADDVDIPASSAARAIAGKGAEAMIRGATVTVGSPRLAEESRVMSEQTRAQAAVLEREGKTVVIVWRDDTACGLIALRDEPRPDAAEAIRQLRAMSIAPVMLTGDNARTAAAISSSLGIEHRAGLLPEDKVRELRDLGRDAQVMMVGDGINDAPALAAAQVGVAMGSGTDVALETAHAAVLRNRVGDIPGLVRLARAAMSNIRQNVAIALGLKVVFLVTTLLGITGLWIAILADTGATVLVTLNALRLLTFRPERESRTGRTGATKVARGRLDATAASEQK
ncbi:heavy metal translocating P-type ATPase [Marinovum algicola]|uniref:P-type Zn(2+) transporter n=1 Tax=Marinovum algicola TaxID=42444 RepID=A0A975WFQ2_9RHOB|nr:heavy metal translocating P-type ATPase [Marinovum algicola]SEK11716.1 Cd2+/Zn2+-exporting ATPase [Marinovum algicola]SLN72834.1 Lead, cadmium, zinc and mercury-transporting ATPase [Marinovum algicola]